MNTPRRNLLRVLGMNGALALLPIGAVSVASKFFSRQTTSTLLDSVIVHFPNGKSVAQANADLDRWVDRPLYKKILEEYKREGRLIRYDISVRQSPFTIDLEFRSADDRQALVEEFARKNIFKEDLRRQLGYKMTEVVHELSPSRTVVGTQTIKVRA